MRNLALGRGGMYPHLLLFVILVGFFLSPLSPASGMLHELKIWFTFLTPARQDNDSQRKPAKGTRVYAHDTPILTLDTTPEYQSPDEEQWRDWMGGTWP